MKIFKKLLCYRFNTQLILTYGFLFLLCMVAIQACTSYNINRIFIKEYMNSDTIALEQVADKIDMATRQIHDSFVDFYFDDDINSFFIAKNEFSGSLWDFSTSSYENHILFNNVCHKIHTSSNLNLNESVSLYLLDPNGDTLTSSSAKVEHFPEIMDEIRQTFHNEKGNLAWIGPFKSTAELNQLHHSLFLAGRLLDKKNGSDIGYIIVGIESEAFVELFRNYQQAQESGTFSILKQDGSLILSTDRKSSGIAENLPELSMDSKGFITTPHSTDSGEYYINQYPLEVTGWTMYHAIERNSIKDKLSPILLYNWLIASGFLFIGLLLIYLISRLFTNRILMLKRQMDCAYETEYKNPLIVEGKDEIAYLTHSYNDMIQMVQKYTRQIIASEEQKRAAEINFLQMQINTHFLYNVLNSIKVLARMNRNDEIRQTITALVRLLNATLSKQADMISVEQELENVQNYFFLQKQMLQCDVSLCLDAAPDSLSLEIPKLILQPLVENSLLHGLYERASGWIRICAFLDSEDNRTTLHITVEDNGTGIKPDRFDDIWKKSRFNSIGLVNVKERLEIYYGNHFDLSIQNRKAGGIRIDIIIPNP